MLKPLMESEVGPPFVSCKVRGSLAVPTACPANIGGESLRVAPALKRNAVWSPITGRIWIFPARKFARVTRSCTFVAPSRLRSPGAGSASVLLPARKFAREVKSTMVTMLSKVRSPYRKTASVAAFAGTLAAGLITVIEGRALAMKSEAGRTAVS